MVLVGLPKLERKIAETGEEYIHSRIAYFARLPEPTIKELENFISQCEIAANTEEKKILANGAKQYCYFRIIDKVAKRSKRIGFNAALGIVYRPGGK